MPVPLTSATLLAPAAPRVRAQSHGPLPARCWERRAQITPLTLQPATGGWCADRSRPTTGTIGGPLAPPPLRVPRGFSGSHWPQLGEGPLPPALTQATAVWCFRGMVHRSVQAPVGVPSRTYPVKSQLLMVRACAGFSIRKAAKSESTHVHVRTPSPARDGEGPPTGRAAGGPGGRQADPGRGRRRQASRQARPAREAKPTLGDRQGGETVPRYSSRPKASGMSSLEPPRGRFGHAHAT